MLKILVLALTIHLLISCGVSSAGTIYYHQDENGVFHFTDLPTSDRYKPFLVNKPRELYREDFIELARVYGLRYSVDPELIRAMIEVESGFDPGAVSRAGAQGLMQIMPETQRHLGLISPFEPESNIEAGTRYFRYLLDRFETLPLALAAYNAGPSRVEHYNGIPPFRETREYVQKVLELYTSHQNNR